MKRSGKKRALSPSNNNSVSASDERCTTSLDSETNQDWKTSLNKLPPWRAECILYKRSRTMEESKTTVSGTDDTSSQTKPILSIHESDWWENKNDNEGSVTSDKTGIDEGSHHDIHENNSCIETYCSDSSTTTGNIRKQPSSSNSGSKQQQRGKKKNKSIFYNIGYHVWNESRAEWKRYKLNNTNNDNSNTKTTIPSSCDSSITDATTRSKSSKLPKKSKQSSSNNKKARHSPSLTSNEYNELVEGLTHVTREYMLPKPMNLADLIEVYVDIWESGHEM